MRRDMREVVARTLEEAIACRVEEAKLELVNLGA
jgi:hypothetical protein